MLQVRTPLNRTRCEPVSVANMNTTKEPRAGGGCPWVAGCCVAHSSPHMNLLSRQSLSSRTPQPRTRVMRPAYPVLTSVAALWATASCAAATSELGVNQPTQELAVVVAAIPRGPSGSNTTATPSPRDSDIADLLAGEPLPRFDQDSDEMPSVGCGGDCPPTFQLETQAKDRQQITARIRYCYNAGTRLSRHMSGTVTVTASIDAAGRPSQVKTEAPNSIAAAVTQCVQRLVETAPFNSKYHWARTASTSVHLPEEP